MPFPVKTFEGQRGMRTSRRDDRDTVEFGIERFVK
jgi:hypothetical protein